MNYMETILINEFEGSFEEFIISAKLDYLADLLFEAVETVSLTPLQEMNVEERRKVEAYFLDKLLEYKIKLSPSDLEAADQEFTGSPMNSWLRKHGYSIIAEGQFKSLLDSLNEGTRTLLTFDEFGTTTLKTLDVSFCSIVQHGQEHLKIISKKGNKVVIERIYPYQKCLVYDGWVDIDTEKINYNVVKDDFRTMKSMKYGCFNKQYLIDAMNCLEKQPTCIFGI